jgi:hypothetical protein
MKYHYIVNPFKGIIAIIFAFIFFISGGAMFSIYQPLPAVLFITIGIVYTISAVMNGTVVHVDKKGINKSVFGIVTMMFQWEEINELGVCGTNVFHKHHPKKTGTLYIYISKNKLDEQERFDMILKWPPKDKIYFVYTKKHLEAIQLLSKCKIKTYNTGNLML